MEDTNVQRFLALKQVDGIIKLYLNICHIRADVNAIEGVSRLETSVHLTGVAQIVSYKPFLEKYRDPYVALSSSVVVHLREPDTSSNEKNHADWIGSGLLRSNEITISIFMPAVAMMHLLDIARLYPDYSGQAQELRCFSDDHFNEFMPALFLRAHYKCESVSDAGSTTDAVRLGLTYLATDLSPPLLVTANFSNVHSMS